MYKVLIKSKKKKCPKESALEDKNRKDGENNEKAMDEMSGRSFSDRDYGDRSGNCSESP